eukprot:TRINITY_DN67006_c6_g1_i1.p1 TRINITY_DN67006_c6_g1~~TRINITY_DN67006_c6_g1_i1.p1  ORF type:complete len:129 (+),score=0.44 TRINITY_DN67006_c6_g1_i1:757-1143(+)
MLKHSVCQNEASLPTLPCTLRSNTPPPIGIDMSRNFCYPSTHISLAVPQHSAHVQYPHFAFHFPPNVSFTQVSSSRDSPFVSFLTWLLRGVDAPTTAQHMVAIVLWRICVSSKVGIGGGEGYNTRPVL